MRGPGFVPGIFFMEYVCDHIADTLAMSNADVREKNFYKVGDQTPIGHTLSFCNLQPVWGGIKSSAEYDTRRAAVDTFNKACPYTLCEQLSGRVV